MRPYTINNIINTDFAINKNIIGRGNNILIVIRTGAPNFCPNYLFIARFIFFLHKPTKRRNVFSFLLFFHSMASFVRPYKEKWFLGLWNLLRTIVTSYGLFLHNRIKHSYLHKKESIFFFRAAFALPNWKLSVIAIICLRIDWINGFEIRSSQIKG